MGKLNHLQRIVYRTNSYYIWTVYDTNALDKTESLVQNMLQWPLNGKIPTSGKLINPYIYQRAQHSEQSMDVQEACVVAGAEKNPWQASVTEKGRKIRQAYLLKENLKNFS